MSDDSKALVVENVTKAFGGRGGFRAVDRLSFGIDKGSCYGFIGPNGAGKTTTLRMIATLSEPDDGEITVCGYNTIDYPEKVRSRVGYMPDDVGMYDGVRVWEYLEFFASAYRIAPSGIRKLVQEVMELTDLEVISTKFTTTLSKGMRQRLILAKTLLHDPELLVLDEPAAGLDPRARIELRLLIKELQKMGKTVIVSSHILTELSDIVDSVGIIEQGQMIATGKVDEIIGEDKATLRLRVRLAPGEDFQGDLDRAANLLRAIDSASDVAISIPFIDFSFAGSEQDIPKLLAHLIENGVPISGVEHQRRNLEDIFLSVTAGAVA